MSDTVVPDHTSVSPLCLVGCITLAKEKQTLTDSDSILGLAGRAAWTVHSQLHTAFLAQGLGFKRTSRRGHPRWQSMIG